MEENMFKKSFYFKNLTRNYLFVKIKLYNSNNMIGL